MQEPGAPRRPVSRTARGRYLEVAAEVAAAVRPGAGRSYLAALVDLAELGDLLGRPRTSLYRLWPSQHDFWSDLTVHLVFQNDFHRPDEGLPWDETDPVGALPHRRDPLADVDRLRTGLQLMQDAVVADPWVQIRASLLGYADLPGVAEARRAVEGRRIRHLGRRIAEILGDAGLAVAPPLRAEDSAAALWCLGDGFAVLQRSRPAIAADGVAVDDGLGPQPWGLMAYAIRATLAETSAPGREEVAPGPRPDPAGAVRPGAPDRWAPARQEALDAASALFLERVRADLRSPAGDGDEIRSLGHVTVAAVARAAGVSRRSVYNHWSSSDELRLDLLRWLLAAERRRYVSALDRVAAGREPAGPGRTAAALTAMLVHPVPDRLPLPHLPLAFLAELGHPVVRATLERGQAETISAVAARVERLWPAAARPSGERLGAERLAVLLLALATGANRLLRVHPTALRPAAPARHGSAALAATLQSLLDHGES